MNTYTSESFKGQRIFVKYFKDVFSRGTNLKYTIEEFDDHLNGGVGYDVTFTGGVYKGAQPRHYSDLNVSWKDGIVESTARNVGLSNVNVERIIQYGAIHNRYAWSMNIQDIAVFRSLTISNAAEFHGKSVIFVNCHFEGAECTFELEHPPVFVKCDIDIRNIPEGSVVTQSKMAISGSYGIKTDRMFWVRSESIPSEIENAVDTMYQISSLNENQLISKYSEIITQAKVLATNKSRIDMTKLAKFRQLFAPRF